jgi:hypothetical protein
MSTATRLERVHTLAGAEAVMAPAALATFLAHPEGVQWLHRVVLAAQFVITLRAGAGVRLVSEFLELSGLSAFVGASYGSQQALNVALEQAIVEVAGAQRAALAQGMAPREVTVCEDETFQPAICLVALEPVSNFIVLEQYAHDRSAETWTQALAAACEGLAITVIQGTSDEAKALCRHIERAAQAHHSPHLFHLAHEVSQATSLALARAVRQAEAQERAAEAQWHGARAAEQAYRQRPHGPGRPPAFAQRIQAARRALAQATLEREQAQARQQEARDLIAAFSERYHPYHLQDGQVQAVEQVAAGLDTLWQRLEALARAADLPARAHAHLAKAKRLTGALLATLTFFIDDRLTPRRGVEFGARHRGGGPRAADPRARSGAGSRTQHPGRGAPSTARLECTVARTAPAAAPPDPGARSGDPCHP